jgi:hypothetical protein
MNNSLNFLETLTIEEFKSRNSASLQVMAKESGHWFRCGGVSGHVSKYITVSDFKSPDQLLISLVEADNGEFWMMHKVGQQNVVATL